MKGRKAFLLATLLLVAVMLIAAGCGSKPAPDQGNQDQGNEEKLKVGFVFIGPVTDGGWNTANNNGRLYLEKQLDYVETVFVQNVPAGSDAERVMRQMIQEGAKIIVAGSFNYGDTVKKLAQEFPDLYFLWATGVETSANISTYDIREYEGTYLTGMVAGKMTKTNIIGYVAANPIPAVVRAVDGFAMGVKAVNPDAKVKLIWTSTWYDPAKEKEAALSLADEKADVLAQFQDSPAVQQAAQERGIYSIGYHGDMRQFAPDANLTSFVWNWGPLFTEEVRAYHDGTWKGKVIWAYAPEIAPLNEKLVPAEVQDLVAETKEKFTKGELKVFQGPIKDNKGNVIAGEGQIVSDEDLMKANWLLDNVEGALP
jgi:basic membrane protein A